MKRYLILITALGALLFAAAQAHAVSLITKEELKPLLGSENVIILDVRTGRDWSTSEFKIPGAERVDGRDFASWSDAYSKEKKIVLYCA